MGGYFGAVSKRDVVMDVFFGTDYHSHLGTKMGGMAIWSRAEGFQREIHSISTTPFRAKFQNDIAGFSGTAGIGCISDGNPQPLIVRSHLGVYALATIGAINNREELVARYFSAGGRQLMVRGSGEVNDTELVAALINEEGSFVEGIGHVHEEVDGAMSILILTAEGEIVAARDRVGHLPMIVAKNHDGYCVTFESFAGNKLGYVECHNLGPGEIARVRADGWESISPPGDTLRVCSFLWMYYGYPNSSYEGINVEAFRYRNGEVMACTEMERGTLPEVDYVAGMPDSGIPHAIGFANAARRPFARPFIKYTPTWLRSFMPPSQEMRSQIAAMKQVPVPELIKGKRMLLVDDSIVRGTQLKETVEYLREAGAAEIHMRSASPPMLHSDPNINFSRSVDDMELIARRTIHALEGEAGLEHLAEYSDTGTERGRAMCEAIAREFKFDSLDFQTLAGFHEALGLGPDKVCTYHWTGSMGAQA